MSFAFLRCFDIPKCLTKGLRPLDPRPAGGRYRGRPRVHESTSSLIHQLVNPSTLPLSLTVTISRPSNTDILAVMR